LRLRLKLERQQTSGWEGSQEVYRYTREDGEVTECMIVEEWELTGCGSRPFVGQILYCVTPVPAVVSRVDPDASG